MIHHVESITKVDKEAEYVLFGVVGVLENVEEVPDLSACIPTQDSPFLAHVDDVLPEGMVHSDVSDIARPQLV